jgi:hypothetical protein
MVTLLELKELSSQVLPSLSVVEKVNSGSKPSAVSEGTEIASVVASVLSLSLPDLVSIEGAGSDDVLHDAMEKAIAAQSITAKIFFIIISMSFFVRGYYITCKEAV